ncbi:MAG: hypothetical protein ACLGHN_12055 [Bacteriovoracia bacterium]
MAVINSKKTLSLVLLAVLTSSACEKEVAVGDRLTDEERAYLRARAAAKCIAASESNFENFVEDSNAYMLSYHRDQTWKYEYKLNNTTQETSYIYVWKVNPPHVYFRLKVTEAGVTTNKFIKLDTTGNEEMAENIQKLKCDKTLTVSDSASAMTATKKEDRTREDSETWVELDYDYRLRSTLPVYFSALNFMRTKRSYDNNLVLTQTNTYDYVITDVADTAQPSSYTDSTIVNRQYCVVEYLAPTPPATLNVFAVPFQLECTSSDTIGPDANGDTTEDFDPATEL